MAKLPRRNQYSIRQLLELWIPSLRLIQDLADKVDRALNLIGVPGFFSFDDDGSADDTIGCSDVDQ